MTDHEMENIYYLNTVKTLEKLPINTLIECDNKFFEKRGVAYDSMPATKFGEDYWMMGRSGFHKDYLYELVKKRKSVNILKYGK